MRRNFDVYIKLFIDYFGFLLYSKIGKQANSSAVYLKEVLMSRKSLLPVMLISVLLIAVCPGVSAAKQSKHGSKSHAGSSRGNGKKSPERSENPSPLALGLDSVFIKMKKELDDMVASPVMHGKPTSPVNSYFLKTLKENQPFYSFTRANQNGEVVNEMIRLVEKADEKKQNVSKEPWFKQAAKKRAEYSGVFKMEESGRYYLLWAVPVVSAEKGKESFEGAVALKIDLWDSFHKFSSSIATPFLIRMDRLHLYSNKWKDTIAYKEELFKVPGVKRMIVRYPKDMTEVAVAPVESAPAPETPAIDSTKIKAAQDSLKTLLKQNEKKKAAAKTRTIIIAVLVVLIIIMLIFLFIIIPQMKQRAIMKDIDHL
jgi:hypothetical protein